MTVFRRIRCRKITEKGYSVRGCTALPDAVANAIRHIGNVRKYARKEHSPEKNIFAITTDGMEDAGHPYSCGRVKQMAERQKEKYGREFLFPGAGIDVIETAGRLVIFADRTADHNSGCGGTGLNYEVPADAVRVLCRRADRCGREKRTGEDYEKRGKKGKSTN